MIKIKFKIYKWQYVIGSGVEQVSHCQWCLCVKQCKHITDSGMFALAHLIMISLPLDQHHYCHQRRYCQWRVYKDVTVSDAFTLFYTKTSLAVARLLHATTSGALPFVDFKIYFYHSYY
jgi:hypothetical protein